MKCLAVVIFFAVGLSACAPQWSTESTLATATELGRDGPFPKPKPVPPQLSNFKVIKPTPKPAQSKPDLVAQENQISPTKSLATSTNTASNPDGAGISPDDVLFGTAVTAEEAVRRTIQALAWNDELELALVAPSLNLTYKPTRAVPRYRIVRSEKFTPARTNDWNELSLQPSVHIGDILVRTSEVWSEPQSHYYAYLVRRSKTGWVVLSRKKYNYLVG